MASKATHLLLLENRRAIPRVANSWTRERARNYSGTFEEEIHRHSLRSRHLDNLSRLMLRPPRDIDVDEEDTLSFTSPDGGLIRYANWRDRV